MIAHWFGHCKRAIRSVVVAAPRFRHPVAAIAAIPNLRPSGSRINVPFKFGVSFGNRHIPPYTYNKLL